MSDDQLWAASYLATRKTSGGVLDISHNVAVLRAEDQEQARTQALSAARQLFPASQGWGGWHALVCTVLPPHGRPAPPPPQEA